MSDFYIKRNDTSPAIKYQLQDDAGDAVDISGANDVRFLMRQRGGDTVKVDDNLAGNVSLVDASTGIVQYDWQDGDTDTAGQWWAEWEVEYSDGTIETFPNDQYILVRVEEDIG